MGDFIKENPFTAGVIFTMVMFFIFAFAIAKPYVDGADKQLFNDVATKMDTVIKYQIETNNILQDLQ